MRRILMLVCAAGLLVTGCEDPDSGPTTRPSPTASRVMLTAFPTTVLRSGSDVTVTARVTSDLGANVEGTPVTFSTTAGTLSTTSALTSSLGSASVTLSGGDPARVTATASGVSNDIEIGATAPFAVTVATPSQVFTDGATFGVDVTPNRDAVNPPGPVALTLNCGVGDTVDVTIDRSRRCVFPSAGEFTVQAAGRAANGWTTTDSVRVTATSRTSPPPSSSSGALSLSAVEIGSGVGYAEWRFTATASAPMNSFEFAFGDYKDVPPGNDPSKGTKTDKAADGEGLTASVQFIYHPVLTGGATSKEYEVTVTGFPRSGGQRVTVSQKITVTVGDGRRLSSRKRHELDRDRAALNHPAVSLLRNRDPLRLTLRADRRDQHAAWRELVEQRLRNRLDGGGHDDPIERRALRPSGVAVALAHLHVRVPELFQRAACPRRQLRHDLD